MADGFFGQNMVGQEQWARRGENDARIAAMANFTKATTAGRLIQAGTTVGTTNGSGILTITYPASFSAGPLVVVMNGDGIAKDDVICSLTNVTATTFDVIATNSAGARITASLLRFNWIAFGA